MRKTHVEKKHQGGRIVLYVISMVLLLGVFSGLLYLRWEKPPEMIIAEADGPETTEAIEKSAPAEPEETAAPEPTPMPTPEPTPEPMPDGTPFSVTNASALQRADGVYTMLFVGVDQISESTDTMILCRFDTKNHKVNCVSLPRDTLINIAWDVRKLNSVYSASLHNGGTGIDSLLMHVKWLTGIDVDCYAVVDLMTFQYVINELGGVWFDVPIEMNYWDIGQDLYIDIHPGYQLLDGFHCMCLCRFREDYQNGDLGRIEMQQAFLKAAAQQFLTLGNIPHVGNVIKLLSDGLQTNLNAQNIAWFLRQALQCRSRDIHFYTMPCTTRNISGYSYAVVEPYNWLNMLNENFNPYTSPLSYGNLNIVYYDGNQVASTTEVQDRGYYDDNSFWGDLDLDWGWDESGDEGSW